MAKAKTKTAKSRRLKIPKYKSFRLSKRLKTTQPNLPSAFQLLKQSIATIKAQKRFFIGVSLVYGALSLLLVRGITGGVDVIELRNILDEPFAEEGGIGNFTASLAIFGMLVGSTATSDNEQTVIYQTIILFIVSLAVIWGLRQMQNTKDNIKIREAFYQGMYPLIPVLLIVFVIGLQLLPASIGATIYTITVVGGIAVTAIEQIAWVFFVLLLALLSFYMISSSIFAFYIATLPNMTPMRALRSARQLVMHRRWTVMRKILYIFIILLLVVGLIVIPAIAFLPRAAEFIFFSFWIILLPFIHTYMYTLYRKLL